MWWEYAAEAGLGLIAGVIPAAYRLTTTLCGGETAPPDRERHLAWARFLIAMLAAPLFSGTMTATVVAWSHGLTTWPEVAVFFGIASNALWPAIMAGFSEAVKIEVRKRLAKALDALRGTP